MNTYTEFIEVAALFAGLFAIVCLLAKWEVLWRVLLTAVILLVGLVYFYGSPLNHSSFKERMELSAMSLYEQINPSLCSNPAVTRKVISLHRMRRDCC